MVELKAVKISFKKISSMPRQKRANRMIHSIQAFARKQSPESEVKLSRKLNEFVWAFGREHAQHSIALLFHSEKNKVSVYLQQEEDEVKKSIEKAEKKKKKKAKEKKEKKKEEEKKKPAEEKALEEEEKKKLEEKKEKEKAFEKSAIKKGTV